MPKSETFTYVPLLQHPRRRRIRNNGGYHVDGVRQRTLWKWLSRRFFGSPLTRKRKSRDELPYERVMLELSDKKPTHRMTRKLLAALRIWKLTPQEYHVLIFDEEFATGIDCVARNEKGELVLLELFHRTEPPIQNVMKPPLDTLENTAWNQHLVHAAVICRVLETHYDLDCFERTYVVQVDRKGVTKRSLPPWARTLDKTFQRE